MKSRAWFLLLSVWLLSAAAALGQAAAQAAPAPAATAPAAPANHASPQTAEFAEHLVDLALDLFDVRTDRSPWIRYAISAVILLIAYVLRHLVTRWIFGFFKLLASRTKTTLDDKLFPALEAPVSTLIVVVGAVAALKALKLSDTADNALGYIYTGAFSLILFWAFLRALSTVLDHMQEIALERQLGITPFLPWIKKTIITIVFVFGVLMIAQSLGADVKAFLAGLGIGGLAFALAAQDTIANIFGSVVVAIDQPFKIGETVRIGAITGTVEDIGLRSTRVRALDKSLISLPNKSVAAEAITNLSRFTGRRVEQVFGLTYNTRSDQMAALVADIRALVLAEPGVDPASVNCYFRDFSASSLDVWLVYLAKDADFARHMELRQRLNLAIMRLVESRGLSFAFPTQTLHVASLPPSGAR